MAATPTKRWAEIQRLQTTIPQTSTFSLYDLRKAYYGGNVSTNDALRAYLQSQTGLTTIQSLSDLWRQFFIGKGVVNRVSLTDMAVDFFTNTGFTIPTLAFDTAVNGGLTNPGTSLTWSHTCTGSNLILFVAVFGNVFGIDGTGANITGVTYNGVPLTLIGKSNAGGINDRWVYLYYLINPSPGTNNVVVSASQSIAIGGDSASYTGARQFSQPDASNTGTATSATSLTTSLTTIADNCWTIYAVKNGAGADPAAGTGSTLRAHGNGMSLFDSNAAIHPAGSTSMQSTGSSGNWEAVIASVVPVLAITMALALIGVRF